MLQEERLDEWLPHWKAMDAIELIWVEGSMADPERLATPVSDIDLRFAIRDEAYERLWKNDRTALFQHCGPFKLPESGFFRGLFPPGLIVEAWAHEASKVDSLRPYLTRILHARERFDDFAFQSDEDRGIKTEFPNKVEINRALIDTSYHWLLWMEAQCFPRSLLKDETLSVAFGLDWNRLKIIELMYINNGVNYPNRNREFSRILSEEERLDLAKTYPGPTENLEDKGDLERIWNRLVDVWMRTLDRLGARIGYRVDRKWLDLSRAYVEKILASETTRECV